MNKLQLLKRLNMFFVIVVTLFNIVATVNIGIEVGQHGLEWTELIVENGEIVETTRSASSMFILVFFLWFLLSVLLMNVQFLRSLEETDKPRENEQESSQSQQNV